MDDNLYDLFRGRFPEDRARVFVETASGATYSYGDIEAESARLAGHLADLGVVKGDRVAVQVEKSPEAMFLYLACLRLRAAYLPLNTAYKPGEIDYFLGDAEPKVFVCDPAAVAFYRDIAASRGVAHLVTLDADGGGTLIDSSRDCPVNFATVAGDADDIATILYTSGTTGRSKGAMLSHRNLGANALTLHRIWGFTPDDVLLHALPLFHAHGLYVATNCALLSGGSVLFLPRFDVAEVIRLLPRATVFMGVPTFYTRLLAESGFSAEICARMRLFISGSAPLLEETFEAFRDRSGHAILERYGMTETGMNCSNPLDGERVAGTVGPPLPDVEARIRDEDGKILPQGEIGGLEVRGPNVFSGYWRMPEKTREEFREDGFFITGDLARIDASGYVTIVGRAKDLVISGGYNVYPKEVEACIDAIAGVDESAVIGIPHADFGEAVTAVVTRAPGGKTVDETTIIATVKDQLANFKVPKRVFFAEELPRNTMGKVQKNILRERYADTSSDSG